MTACKPDWNLIQSLYFKGFTPKQIEEQTGVKRLNVSVQASRKGWRKALLETSAIVVKRNGEIQGKTEDNPESNALTKASASVRKGLSDELLRAVATLTATKPSKALRTQAQRASVMQTLAGAAKPVFGWSEGQSQPAVRISIMDSAVVMSQEPERQAIDVTPVPALPAPECPDQT